jgi:CheY-like chemotaxis protein
LVVKALCRALEGHVVVSASSGREAIELLKQGEPFDLVLCDVMMPDLTGADVYEAAQEVGMERRIVFVTGGAFTSSARAFLVSVPNRRIEKPFSRDRVRSLLDVARETIVDG